MEKFFYRSIVSTLSIVLVRSSLNSESHVFTILIEHKYVANISYPDLNLFTCNGYDWLHGFMAYFHFTYFQETIWYFKNEIYDTIL